MKRLPAPLTPSGMVALVAVLAILAGCGGSAAATPTPASSLDGTSWQLVSIDGRELETDVTPTLAVSEAGEISGTAVCNSYMGTARIEGSSIVIGPLATTQVACSGAAGVLERQFLAALDEANAWAIDGSGRLVLEGGDVLVFEPAALPS